jgi:hypothetical protein
MTPLNVVWVTFELKTFEWNFQRLSEKISHGIAIQPGINHLTLLILLLSPSSHTLKIPLNQIGYFYFLTICRYRYLSANHLTKIMFVVFHFRSFAWFSHTYSVFQRFGQAIFEYVDLILSLNQFSLLPQSPLKTILAIKVVKIGSKISILLPSMKHSV